ncbi:MAG: pilus assembly protein PilW [Comamonadaceae bacterium]|nr:MAG: pilus assembly protein PilW [Comamonadaceae bacterium]
MKAITRKQARGLSLIELMIAILIGLILLVGVIQVFAAARTAYQLSAGLARAQENGRFAVDYLQRDIRMAGHFGCVNDQARLQIAGNLTSHLVTTVPALNFGISIQGYEANNTAPANTITLASPAAGWSPALPTYISNLNPAPRPGSDIVVLRFLASDGVPVTGITGNQVTVDPAKWNVLTNDGIASPALFGIGDCTYADVFQATTVSAGAGAVTASASSGANNNLPIDFASRYTASPSGQTTLYRAEAIVYYIGTRAGAAGSSLYRMRFNTAANGTATLATPPEELVEGVENMQLIYGRDQGTVDNLTGSVTNYQTANVLAAAETEWRRVGQNHGQAASSQFSFSRFAAWRRPLRRHDHAHPAGADRHRGNAGHGASGENVCQLPQCQHGVPECRSTYASRGMQRRAAGQSDRGRCVRGGHRGPVVRYRFRPYQLGQAALAG